MIREALKPYTASAPCYRVGGFASQRLIVTDPGPVGPIEVTRAFRIGPAASTPLTSPMPEICSDSALAANGIFKVFRSSNSKTSVDLSVFETLGVQYLRDTADCSLMLLDEIGGHELTCKPFMNALYELLSGDIPCIGVIKLTDSTKRMDPALFDLNSQLRHRILNEFDGKILYYERGDETVRKIINDYLEGILHE